MRHPPIEALFQDVLANPRSPGLRAWVRANNGFDEPVPVHLPSGAVVHRRIVEDTETAAPWMGGGAMSIMHRGERLWVSGLPASPDQPHLIVLAAFDPDTLLDGPAAKDRPKPGVAVQFVTRKQAAMLLRNMELPAGADPEALVKAATKAGRSRVKTNSGRTVVLERTTERTETGSEKMTDLVRMSIWPERGVAPGVVFGTPTFEGVVSARLNVSTPSNGIAIRLSQLDRVGQCLFVGENDIHHLLLGLTARAQTVPFEFLRDVAPAGDYANRAVATYLDIRGRSQPGQSLEDVSRRAITEDDLVWARDRLPPLFAAIAAAAEQDHLCWQLKYGWEEARKDVSAGASSYGRGSFGGAGIDPARRQLESTDLVEDLDRFISFWPRERVTLVEEALREELGMRVTEEPGLEP